MCAHIRTQSAKHLKIAFFRANNTFCAPAATAATAATAAEPESSKQNTHEKKNVWRAFASVNSVNENFTRQTNLEQK